MPDPNDELAHRRSGQSSSADVAPSAKGPDAAGPGKRTLVQGAYPAQPDSPGSAVADLETNLQRIETLMAKLEGPLAPADQRIAWADLAAATKDAQAKAVNCGNDKRSSDVVRRMFNLFVNVQTVLETKKPTGKKPAAPAAAPANAAPASAKPATAAAPVVAPANAAPANAAPANASPPTPVAAASEQAAEGGAVAVDVKIELPLPRTLEEVRRRLGLGETFTNKQIRDAYNAGNAEIAGQNEQWKAQGLTAEERARKAHEQRHDLRMVSRAMMGSPAEQLMLLVRDAQKYGDGQGPTFEQLVESQHKQGKSGDAAFEAIIASSQRTDKATTERVDQGEQKPPTVDLPAGTTVHGDRVVVSGMNQEQIEVRVKGGDAAKTSTKSRPGAVQEITIGKGADPAAALKELGDELKGIATTPRQKTNDITKLYEDAGGAQAELTKMTETIAGAVGAKAKIPPELKGQKRALEKTATDYGGEAARLVDLARTTIECDTMEQVREAQKQVGQYPNVKVIRTKDRFVKPADGYRDLMMNLEMSNGHIVEMQIHHSGILKVKQKGEDGKGGEGHHLYEVIRGIDAAAEKGPLTPDQVEARKNAVAEMGVLYNAAWDKIQADEAAKKASPAAAASAAPAPAPQAESTP